jgi:tRNA (guanine-N7-)-methyltransferase
MSDALAATRCAATFSPMRGIKELSPAAAAFEVVPEDSRPLDLDLIFGRIAPLEVDLGCGDGSFLTELAAQNPERNFLGVEKLFGRVRSACKKVARLELSNARILRADIPHTTQQLLPTGSVAVFHLLFPDPWPKRRHHVRRVFTTELLASLARALTPDGLVRVATDDSDYFQEMTRVLGRVSFFQERDDLVAAALPSTTFERRFLDRGLEIHRLVLRKVSDPT